MNGPMPPLPTGGPDAFPATPPAAVTSESTIATETLDGIRVLVVEDEPDTCDYLDQFLRTYGADVTCARSANEALAQLAESRPDILVSDIGLPDIDGYELMQRIRRLPADSSGAIPAICRSTASHSPSKTTSTWKGYRRPPPAPDTLTSPSAARPS